MQKRKPLERAVSTKRLRPPKKYLTADEAAPDVAKVAYIIPEFCAAHRISVAMYYKLKNAGKGPRESHAGAKVIITLANAAAWLKQLEMQPAE
jgi:hypothetical protein